MKNIFCFEYEARSGYPKRTVIRKKHIRLDSIVALTLYPHNDEIEDGMQVLEITCQLLDDPIQITGWPVDIDSYAHGEGYQPSKFKHSYDALFAAWTALHNA